MKTTLSQIKYSSSARIHLEDTLRQLGKSLVDDEPIDIIAILDHQGIFAALRSLDAVYEPYLRQRRMFGIWCARQSKHFLAAERPDSVQYLDRVLDTFVSHYILGRASKEELEKLRRGLFLPSGRVTAASCARQAVIFACCDQVSSAAWAAKDAFGVAAAVQARIQAQHRMYVTTRAEFDAQVRAEMGAASRAAHTAALAAQETALRSICRA